ncbi:leukocyte immunoglobulin-like receptor subfamily A member 4 [Trachinotus anak]|uniref:leukocyte immunoglobulin-like receptor subfamily A member 4 n=1 Tax=Trachinotus anak TaxID=443729 RepID=UPI0039F1A74D
MAAKPKAQLSADKRTIPAGGRGGVYSCRGGRGDPVYYTEKSQEVRIDTIVPNRAVVTLQPDWTEIYRGERISVSCQIQGGDTEWTYEWETTSSLKPSNQHEYRISSASSSHSGEYRCRGRHRRDPYSSTEWSKGLKVTVSPKPKAQLSADKRTIPAGGRVTLTCSVDPSSGWKYDWYRDNKLSEPLNTHDADFHTPDWTEIYRGERISVSCQIQGGDTEWTYEWETTSSLKPSNQHEYRISSASSSHSGEYRCRGRHRRDPYSSTEWSKGLKVTVSRKSYICYAFIYMRDKRW